MPFTDSLSPEDAALVEREAGNALRALYLPIVHEPLPDGFSALLQQLATQEGRGDAQNESLRASAEPSPAKEINPFAFVWARIVGAAWTSSLWPLR